MKIIVIGSGSGRAKQMLMLAALAAAGHEVVIEDMPVNIKGMRLAEPVIRDECPAAYANPDKKSKGEKKRQRSEWNNSMYNNRKGLQRG